MSRKIVWDLANNNSNNNENKNDGNKIFITHPLFVKGRRCSIGVVFFLKVPFTLGSIPCLTHYKTVHELNLRRKLSGKNSATSEVPRWNPEGSG